MDKLVQSSYDTVAVRMEVNCVYVISYENHDIVHFLTADRQERPLIKVTNAKLLSLEVDMHVFHPFAGFICTKNGCSLTKTSLNTSKLKIVQIIMMH